MFNLKVIFRDIPQVPEMFCHRQKIRLSYKRRVQILQNKYHGEETASKPP